LAKSNFEQSRSRPIHKALATHIWVATHGLINAALDGSISLKFSLEIRLESASFETSIDFLAFLVQKL